MGKYENNLIKNDFIRIHRTNIVNKLFIIKIEKPRVIRLLVGTYFTISKREEK